MRLMIFITLYFSFCTIARGQEIRERIQNEIKKGNMEAAFIDAKKEYERIKRKRSIGKDDITALKELGNFYFDFKKYQKAVEVNSFLCQESQKLYGVSSNEYTKGLFQLTGSYEALGNFEEANEHYLRLIDVYKDMLSKTDKEYLFTLDDYARFNLKWGKFEVARLYFLECLEGYKIIFGENSERVGVTLNNLGVTSFKNGGFVEAENYFNAAMKVYSTAYLDKQQEYILTLKNIIQLYKSNDVLAKALPVIEQLYAILSKGEIASTLEFADFLDELFDFYLQIGDDDKAILFWERAYNIRKALTGRESIEIAKSLYNLGYGAFREGSMDEAESKFYEAHTMATKFLKPDDVKLIKYNIGLASAYRANEKYESALDIYISFIPKFVSYLKEDRYTAAVVNANLGEIWVDMGDLEQAEKSYLSAYSAIENGELFSSDNELTLLFDIAILYGRMKDFEKAEPYIKKAYGFVEKRIRNNASFFSEKEREMFIDFIKPKIDYLNAYSVAYSFQKPEMLDLIIKNNLLYKNLMFDESIKMKNIIEQSNDANLKSLYAQLIAKRESLSKFYSVTPDVLSEKKVDIVKIEHEVNDLEKEIALATAEKRTLEQIASYRDLMASLNEAEAAIEFVDYFELDSTGQMDKRHYGVIILKRDLKTPIFVDLGVDEEVQYDIYNYYINSILSREKDLETYKRTWGKFEAYLSDVKKVYVSNEGIFHKINHETIFCPESNSYLIEKYDITILFSLRELKRKIETKNNFDYVFLFGYPKYDIQELKSSETRESVKDSVTVQRIVKDGKVIDLPGTEEEIKHIESIFRKRNIVSNSFSREFATKRTFLSMSNPSIVHIATHGFYVPDAEANVFLSDVQKQKAKFNPYLKCGLLFAGCNQYVIGQKEVNDTDTDNGIVTALDVLNMDLSKTDLVVLSACQTGLGESKAGEAMYSLQRAFQMAGAKSVIMSLWSVSDNATQIFMIKFYENLLVNKNKLDAFKNAQEYLISETNYKHPYYWGAFVLVGF